MRVFTTILIFLASALLLYNISQIDFSNFFEGDSKYALIGVGASICAILILLIFKMSKEIEKRMNQ